MNFVVQLLFLFFILVSPQLAHAASPSLSLSPPKYDLTVQAGQIQQVSIKITNNSTFALPAHVEIMDFSPKDAEGAVTYGVSMPGRSAKDWFSIKNPDMLLSPNESNTVTVTIYPPENAAVGSYFAVVMFQISPSQEQIATNQSRATVAPWLGTLFLLKNGGATLSENDLKITRFDFPQVTNKSKIPVTLELENNTNFHITPDTDFELQTIFGKVVAKTIIEKTTVMPGMKRIIHGELEQNAPLGFYKSVANVRVAGFEKSVTGGTLYLVTLIGLGLLIAFLAGFGHSVHHTVRHRHRYKNRFKAAWQAITQR